MDILKSRDCGKLFKPFFPAALLFVLGVTMTPETDKKEVVSQAETPKVVSAPKVGAPKEVLTHSPTLKDKQNWCNKNKDCTILSEAAYYEARGETDAGVVAVMHTILNRVNKEGRWPNTIKEVVYQNKQFSYTWDGSLKKGMNDKKQVDRMLIVAYDVLNGLIDSPVGSSDHYHTVYVNPSWSKHLNYTYHVGNHKFYRSE